MHTAPHALKAVSAAGGTSDTGWRPSSTCSLADGAGGLRGCWARGREGQAWVVGCVCPTRPHIPAWKGAGAVHSRVTCPVFLSSEPHTPPACGRSLQAPPQPGRSGVLAPGAEPHTSQQLDIWFLLLGMSHAHTHANTAVCPRMCIQIHVHAHTHPHVHTCLCAHTRLSTHAHPRAHTHPHTHMHCSFPWPFGPQPGACSPAGLRPSTVPTVAPTPTLSSFLHIPRGSSSVTASGASSELGPGARVGLWALVPWAEGGPLSARGWDRPWPPSWHRSCWVGSGLTLRGPETPHWRLSRGPQAGPQVSDLRVSSQPGAAATRTPGSLGGAWGTPVPALLETSAPGLRPGQGQLPAGPGL